MAGNVESIKWYHQKSCPICGSNVSREMARIPDMDDGRGIFTVLFCDDCEIGVTTPQPSADTLHLLYQFDSRDFDAKSLFFVDWLKNILARRLVRRIIGDLQPTRILDFGCGNGRFASQCSALYPGARVYAVDLAENPPASFNSDGHPNLRYRTVSSLTGEEQYEVIILRHVIEHSLDPLKLLANCKDMLVKDGVLYLETPNVYATGASLFGERWPNWYVPRHTFHFSAKSLDLILKQVGLAGRTRVSDYPIMGNLLMNLLAFRTPRWLFQAAGALLFPLQFLIGYRSGSMLTARSVRLT